MHAFAEQSMYRIEQFDEQSLVGQNIIPVGCQLLCMSVQDCRCKKDTQNFFPLLRSRTFPEQWVGRDTATDHL